MSAWLLTIVGVVTIGVLLDILIPEGEVNKYIRGIFGIVVVLVIVAPIPKFLNGDFNLDSIFNDKMEVDSGFVEKVEADKVKGIEVRIANELKKDYPVVRVRIFTKVNSSEVDVIKVYLDKSKTQQSLAALKPIIAARVGKIVNIGEGEVRLYAESSG